MRDVTKQKTRHSIVVIADGKGNEVEVSVYFEEKRKPWVYVRLTDRKTGRGPWWKFLTGAKKWDLDT